MSTQDVYSLTGTISEINQPGTQLRVHSNTNKLSEIISMLSQLNEYYENDNIYKIFAEETEETSELEYISE